MTVRASPVKRRSHYRNSGCLRFNILQQQKSGEPQLPALFYGQLFPPFCSSSSVSRSM